MKKKYLHNTLQAETIEVYKIKIGFRQKSVKKIIELRRKIYKSGKSYNTYNYGSHSSKTY